MSNFKIRSRCPVCRSESIGLLVDIPYSDPDLSGYLYRYYTCQGHPNFARLEGEHYRLVMCKNCNLVFQECIPNEDFLVELYEIWIDPTIIHDMSIDRQFRALRLIKRVIQHIGESSKSIDVLDVGMGWGNWLFAARGLGCSIYGLELSPARIAFGKANGIKMLGWDELDGRTFDIINCEQVLEHLEDPRGALEQMKRCLSPRGMIIVGVPNVSPLVARLRSGRGVDWSGEMHTRELTNPTEAVTPLEHINSFTGQTIRLLADQCNLREVHFGLGEIIRTTALDYDSLKDLIKDALKWLGLVERFPSAVLTHSKP